MGDVAWVEGYAGGAVVCCVLCGGMGWGLRWRWDGMGWDGLWEGDGLRWGLRWRWVVRGTGKGKGGERGSANGSGVLGYRVESRREMGGKMGDGGGYLW